MSISIDQNLVKKLEAISDPFLLIKEILSSFSNRAAIGTSGQLTGSVIIDLACKTGFTPRVFTIDTLRLFPETYSFFEALEKKYSILIEHYKPNEVDLSAMLKEHGEYLFFDSKQKQELCCQIRKVEPNEKALESLDVWLTGLRADQSKHRASVPKIEIISLKSGRSILKVAPLLNWKQDQLNQYAAQEKVPIHPLLSLEKEGWYYESLGCTLCTTPVGPYESRRAGRWRWFNALDPDANKECGIHVAHKDEV